MQEVKQCQAKRWCFTIYHAGIIENHDRWFDDIIADFPEDVQFIVYQVERCPETQRLHIQGYLEVRTKRGIGRYDETTGEGTGVKLILRDGAAHLAVARGSAEDSIKYCTKEASRVQAGRMHGEVGQQGRRSDIRALHERIRETEDWKSLVTEEASIIKYYRGCENVHATIHAAKPRRRPSIILLIGGPGIGKSRWAHSKYPDAYVHFDNTTWWEQYTGQDTIIFDEFIGQMPIQAMLRVLDRHPMSVPIKGGNRSLRAFRFVFTSNLDWREWWPNASKAHIDAFARRITEFGTIFNEEEIKAWNDAQPQEEDEEREIIVL